MSDPTNPEPIEPERPRPEPETTKHEWDGITEYDNPLPRWWLWVFYLTVGWGLIYMILYPALPLVRQATPGLLGYSSRADVAAEIEAQREANAPLDARIVEAGLAEIQGDAELARYAMAGGGAIFRNHCSQCHGQGAQGFPGYPSLLNDDWLWGGSLEDIHLTITHGVRWEDDPDTRFSQMPAFGDILEADEIEALVEYVRSLSGLDHDAARAAEAEAVYLDQCAACHGDDGLGNRALGAPNLTNNIWQYGGDRDAIRHTIVYSRNGVMPPFAQRLSEAERQKVAFYVHSLGGGE